MAFSTILGRRSLHLKKQKYFKKLTFLGSANLRELRAAPFVFQILLDVGDLDDDLSLFLEGSFQDQFVGHLERLGPVDGLQPRDAVEPAVGCARIVQKKRAFDDEFGPARVGLFRLKEIIRRHFDLWCDIVFLGTRACARFPSLRTSDEKLCLEQRLPLKVSDLGLGAPPELLAGIGVPPLCVRRRRGKKTRHSFKTGSPSATWS